MEDPVWLRSGDSSVLPVWSEEFVVVIELRFDSMNEAAAADGDNGYRYVDSW